MLETGTIAPTFTLADQDGKMHTLEEYRGKKLLLYFYPKDNTSGCTAQACGYTENIGIFRNLGIEVVGVSKDTSASHRKFADKYNLQFTLLADPDKTVINAYDVYKEKKLYGKVSMGVVRTTYVIDEEGKIVFASDKVKAKEDAVKMLAYLQETGK